MREGTKTTTTYNQREPNENIREAVPMELVLYLFRLKCSKRFVIFSSPTPTLIPFAEGNNALRHSPQPANNMEVSKGYLILCFKIMVFLKLEQALAV